MLNRMDSLSSHLSHSFLFLIIHACIWNTYKKQKTDIRVAHGEDIFAHRNTPLTACDERETTESFLLVDFMLSFCSIFLFLWRDRSEVRTWLTAQHACRWVHSIYRSVVKAEWNQSVNQTLPFPVLMQFAPRYSPKKWCNCNFLSPTVTWMLLLNYINLWPGMKMKYFLNWPHPRCQNRAESGNTRIHVI